MLHRRPFRLLVAGLATMLAASATAAATTADQRLTSYANWLVTRMPGLVQKASEPVCEQYGRQRNLGLLLENGAATYSQLPTGEQKDTLRKTLAGLADTLMTTPPTGYLHSTYATLCGHTKLKTDPEFLTIFMIVSGLSAWREVSGDASGKLAAYIRTSWADAVQRGYITYSVGLIRPNGISLPNGWGQFMSFAVDAERAGARALHRPTVERGMRALARAQILTNDRPCGTFRLQYGGWIHSDANVTSRACTQNMGYHRFIVNGVSKFLSFTGPRCTDGPWRRSCRIARSTLPGALAFILESQDPKSRAFFDRAPGSSADQPTTVSNGTGVSLAAQIMTLMKLSGREQEVWLGQSGEVVGPEEINERLRAAALADNADYSGIGRYLHYRSRVQPGGG